MLCLILMALKIGITDLTAGKIRNHDISLLLVISLFQHHLHQFLLPSLILLLGFCCQSYIGSGDTKLLALVVARKPSYLALAHTLSVIFLASILLLLIFLALGRRRDIPIGPALALGLVI